MRLYHQPRTRSTRVLWALEELDAPHELVLIARDDKQLPEHRARHPLGRVPVLEEPGGFVFESAAICLHLADLYPAAGLIGPLDSHERALQYQWTFFAMTELEAPTMDVARQVWSDGEPNVQVVEKARARFAAAAAVLGDALADGFLVGGRFSIADLVAGAVLSFARTAELAELPEGVVAYVDALEARPARMRAYAVTAV